MNGILYIFLLAFLGSIAGLLGGMIVLVKEDLAKKYSIYLISFAAGVMLTVTFLDLLPAAVEKGGESVFVLILVGLVGFFLAEDFLIHYHHHETHEHSLKSAVPLIVISDTLHNFIDGIIICVSFVASPPLGFLVALSTFFHEIPQEIGDYSVLLSTGMSKVKIFIINILSASTTFLGVIGTLLLMEKSQNFIGPLLGVASGMFLYIASADILPELVKESRVKGKLGVAGSFLLGILVMFMLIKLMPE